jgi:hypothetical protein
MIRIWKRLPSQLPVRAEEADDALGLLQRLDLRIQQKSDQGSDNPNDCCPCDAHRRRP